MIVVDHCFVNALLFLLFLLFSYIVVFSFKTGVWFAIESR